MYIKTKEAAEILNVSISTINKMIREGRIKPINEESYRLDGGYLFNKEEVLKLASDMRVQQAQGYSIKEFAELAGVSESIVRADIQKGILPAAQSSFGRREWKIPKEALADYQRKKTVTLDNRTAPIYIEQYYLYQKVAKGNQAGRIVQLSKDETTIQLTDGTRHRVPFQELKTWIPLNSIPHKSIITYPGHVEFQFSAPDHIESPTYQVINVLIHQAGIENVYIKPSDATIYVYIKRISIPKELFHEWVPVLKASLLSGEIIERHQSYLLQPDSYSVNTYVPKKIKHIIQELAEKEGKSLQEKVRELILQSLEHAAPTNEGRQ